MNETLLQRVLFLADRIESPTISHAKAVDDYSAKALAELVSNGILGTKLKATRIPRPARFGIGDDLIVRETSQGLSGVAEGEDYFEPIPLTEEDRCQYEISLPHLVDGIRRENGITASGFKNDAGLISIGTKSVIGAGVFPVYLSLPNENEQSVLARCARLRVPKSEQRAILLLPVSIAFSSEARRVLSDCNVDVLILMESAASGSLALDWAITPFPATRSPAAENTVLFRKDGPVWTLSFDEKTVHVPDMLGLGYIAELLRKPRVAIKAAQLAGVSIEFTSSGVPMTDEATIKAVRADLASKKAALSGLQKNDWARIGALNDKISKLEKYLGQVKDSHGQPRKVAGTAQRSRTSVTNAINRAIDHISAQHPALGRHLDESITKGTTPIYAPVEVPDWRF